MKYCTINCTTKHILLYNLGQYVQYCTKPCTISLSNQYFGCTTFQVVYGVQPFVQSCTTFVQCCTKLYRLYRLYNLLYNIVTVWFADGQTIMMIMGQWRRLTWISCWSVLDTAVGYAQIYTDIGTYTQISTDIDI